jgi:excisionase family DNA binding protein
VTQDEDTLTTQEVARLLNVTDRTVINMAERGDLPGRTIARGKQRLWRFTRHDVDAFLAAQQEHHRAGGA